jgi:hypothetical protein
MKRTLLLIILDFVTGIGIVVILYILSFQPNILPNKFIRKVIDDIVIDSAEVRQMSAQFELSSVRGDSIYLNSKTGVPMITVAVPFKRSLIQYNLLSRRYPDVSLTSGHTFIGSDSFKLVDMSSRIVYAGSINDWKITTSWKDSTHFESVTSLNNGSGMVYLCNKSPDGFYLAKRSSVGEPLFETDSLLTKQVDGTFCKDGKLLFDPKVGRIVYLYYYRNQFVVADTNLSLLYKGKTLDTVSFAKIMLTPRNDKGEIRLAAPPISVNSNGALNNGKLFVYSALKADNELSSSFHNNAVVDVFDLLDGKYQFSFYIPKRRKEKLLEFQFSNSLLVVRYNTGIVAYKLRDQLFK